MVCPHCQAVIDDAAEVCFHCREIVAAITRGTVIAGRYEVQAPLGRGGMGMVYAARDRTLEDVVALKVLRPDVAAEQELAHRFRTEIRLARRVARRNGAESTSTARTARCTTFRWSWSTASASRTC
jgi:hypothetical protein